MTDSRFQRFTDKLKLTTEQAQLFQSALREGNCGRSALVLTPKAPDNYRPDLPIDPDQPAWGNPRILLLPDTKESGEIRPGSLTDYESGLYYPLDLSSVWETAPLDVLPKNNYRCLDLCAAPGGKSILAQTRIRPALHIANEIHPKRLSILRHNLARCGFSDLYTQRLRPDQWAEHAPGCFNLILADAPCSGQSLLAKGISNPGCFNKSVVGGNAKRQRGILLSAMQCLAPGGFLLYTTCTYAPEENERNVHYLLKHFPDLRTVGIPSLEPYRSPITEEACYRLLPFQHAGAGGFSCLLHLKGTCGDLPELEPRLLDWPVANLNATDTLTDISRESP